MEKRGVLRGRRVFLVSCWWFVCCARSRYLRSFTLGFDIVSRQKGISRLPSSWNSYNPPSPQHRKSRAGCVSSKKKRCSSSHILDPLLYIRRPRRSFAPRMTSETTSLEAPDTNKLHHRFHSRSSSAVIDIGRYHLRRTTRCRVKCAHLLYSFNSQHHIVLARIRNPLK